MAKMIKKVLSVDYHRNGVAGNGFHVVRFEEFRGRGRSPARKVGVVFSDHGDVAVLDIDCLADFTGPVDNRHRGDNYECELRDAVAEFETARTLSAPEHLFVGDANSCEHPYYAVVATEEAIASGEAKVVHLCGLTRAAHAAGV